MKTITAVIRTRKGHEDTMRQGLLTSPRMSRRTSGHARLLHLPGRQGSGGVHDL